MFFHDKPGWGIALRIVLVVLLIGGMFWITRAAFYQGVSVGANKSGSGFMMFSDYEGKPDHHHMDEYHDFDGKSGEMFYHHPGITMPYSGYSVRMGHHSGVGFGTGVFHFIFGVLGFFLLVKLIFGFGGMGMYRYGPKGWGPGGGFHHGRYYRHHRCHCPECSGEYDEDISSEKTPEEKPKKK